MVNTNSNNNNNENPNVDSLSPAEMKAYYRGLKRGIGLAFVTMNLREATMLNYARYPQLRFIRGDPLIAAQDLIDQAFKGMNQPIPTIQEISLYDITSQEVGINILSSLMNMSANIAANRNKNNNNNSNNTTPNTGTKKSPGPPVDSNNRQQAKSRNKIPYDRERAKKSGAFDLSREQREELK